MQKWRLAGGEMEREADLAAAARLLAKGGLVAFPTETVYGLGADARNEAAVQRIFRAKGRPADNPLIVHIASATDLDMVILPGMALPAPAKRAMDAFWPGPLTLLLPAHPQLAPAVHPGVELVGVRVPDHPTARALIALAGCPVAAPSANKSGRPSPTLAAHVAEDLAADIDGLVDGGPCAVGLESTVALVTDAEAVILRPGKIDAAALAAATGVPVHTHFAAPAGDGAVAAPGTKYRHYAPNAMVSVWCGPDVAVEAAMARVAATLPAQAMLAVAAQRRVAFPHALRWQPPAGEPYAFALGRELYALLRQFDHAGASHVFIQGPAPTGLGLAVLNRLEKASEGRVAIVP